MKRRGKRRRIFRRRAADRRRRGARCRRRGTLRARRLPARRGRDAGASPSPIRRSPAHRPARDLDGVPDVDLARATARADRSSRRRRQRRSLADRRVERRAPVARRGHFGNRRMRRLAGVVGHLDRQHAAGRQRLDRRRITRSRSGTHWNTAFAKIRRSRPRRRPGREVGLHELAPAAAAASPDAACPATIDARDRRVGKRSISSSVELPGPHPRSTIDGYSPGGTRASRSRAARVRSSSNFRYCAAFQSAISVPTPAV